MLTVTLAAMLARAANRRRGECTRRVGGVNHFLCKVAVSQQELRQEIRKWSEKGGLIDIKQGFTFIIINQAVNSNTLNV